MASMSAMSRPEHDSHGNITDKGKSAIVIFGTETETAEVFQLHGSRLEQREEYRYLGITLHRALGRLRNPSDPSMVKPWDSHCKTVIKKLESRAFLLRRLRCTAGGFSARLIPHLLKAFVVSVATYASEVWNTAGTSTVTEKIEATFAEYRRQALGAYKNTPDQLQRAELGMLSQAHERDICSLMFLHRLVTMDKKRLAPQVFKCLMADTRKGTINGPSNWVTLTVPRILERHGIATPLSRIPAKKRKWRTMVLKAVQNSETNNRVTPGGQSTGTKYATYNNHRGTNQIPPYLMRRVTWGLAQGRSLKTRFRCDTHELESDRGRYTQPETPRDHRVCKCCHLNLPETPYHFTYDCDAYSHIRLQMDETIQKEIEIKDHYSWAKMSWEQKYKFLLSDGPPKGSSQQARQQWVRIETCYYWYLARASEIRRQSIN